jgi:hypothetical protein
VIVVESSDQTCEACGRGGDLVLAGLVMARVGAAGPRPGQQAWFHRQHLPLGWRVGILPAPPAAALRLDD